MMFYFSPKEPPPPPPSDPEWSETESEVNHLQDDNFKDFLKKKKHVLVMFYAPCKRLYYCSIYMFQLMNCLIMVAMAIEIMTSGRAVQSYTYTLSSGNLYQLLNMT
jgi:hypothetical protein